MGGVDGNNFCDVPDVYTQKNMPVHRVNIPPQQDLQKWPHLKHVQIAEIESEIDLLIRTNVPKALEPWQVIRSEDNGPHTVKTMLGWTVNGPPTGDCGTACGMPDMTVNRISVVSLDELWNQQFE